MNERYFVAIRALSGPIEVEAKALAADLGTTAYEERLKLTPGLPAIVLATVDEAAAVALVAKIRARGHRVQLCRASEVMDAGDMVSLKHFTMSAEGLESGTARLAWKTITAIVRARHHEAKQTETVKEKKFDLGRAVMTGGRLIKKTQTKEVVTRNESMEQVLYIFGGTIPWLLREQHTNYGGLGDAIQASAIQNFATAITEFRKRAPHARFDDSLMRRPVTDVDLYVHLLSSAP